MRSGRFLAAAAGAALASALGACYSYRAVPIDQVPVGTPVRARISAAEAERVGQILGRESRLLEGQLLENQPGAGILIAVPTSVGADLSAVSRMHQRITIPPDGLVEVEIRRLDKAKTAGLVGAIGAAVAVAAVAAFVVERGKPDAGDKGGVEQARRPRWPGPVFLRFAP